MSKGLVAQASVTIDAPVDKVWDALVDPALIEQYMFGTNVVSDWEEGSSIVWKGEWQGKPYEDKGTMEARQHSEENWRTMLENLKELMETE